MARRSVRGVTFDVQSSRDMLRKLHWEIDRFKKTDDREARCFFALNAAWTAWHIHDWVWASISADKGKPAYRALAKLAGGSRSFNKDGFRDWLITQPFLELCRIVATSAKHWAVEMYPDSPKSIEARVSARDVQYPSFDDVPDIKSLSSFDDLIVTEWTPKLIVDGEGIGMEVLLERVSAFWTELIMSNDIDP